MAEDIILPYNLDYARQVAIRFNESNWICSPNPQVLRIPLERERAESGITTSIVKYLPNSIFPAHLHPGGEEILVLDGVFEDEHGAYPKGTYMRNPAGTSHTPFSKDGCVLFVKLYQIESEDTKHFTLDSNSEKWQTNSKGVNTINLHQHNGEQVTMFEIPKKTSITLESLVNSQVNLQVRQELFVVTGDININGEDYDKWTWLRYPEGQRINIHTAEGCMLYLKIIE